MTCVVCGECRCISPSAGQEERERMLGRTEDKREEAEEVQEMERHVTEMENESVPSPKNKTKQDFRTAC